MLSRQRGQTAMCGIVGAAGTRSLVDGEWLLAARDTMVHRGPDGCGVWTSRDSRVQLGHRRLSILDLSTAAAQPMIYASGALVIVFNGEVYNFQELRVELAAEGREFVTRSDTEVVLAAYATWGTGCVQRLNGAFSFAIYDEQRRIVFLARDRAGEKPLYLRASAGTLQFASEMKALLADGSAQPRLDREALDSYLAMGFVPGERTMLVGIKRLPPAHAMTFDLDSGAARSWKYWVPPDHAPSGAAEPDDIDCLGCELETLLGDAVRRQLVADVPVGILLSGGLDSSLVTALATKQDIQPNTFTVRFPGKGRLDETDHARLIASAFRTKHHELEADEATVDLLPLLARQFDDPIVDSSMVPTFLVSSLVRKHCTVALGGDGADELFGGYRHYSRLLQLDRIAAVTPLWLRKAIGSWAGVTMPVGAKGRNWLQALAVDVDDEVPLIASYFDPRGRAAMLRGSREAIGAAERLRAQRAPRTGTLLQRAMMTDFQNYLPEDILAKVDRASMRNSLEVRAPFLDYRVIEFAFGRVPVEFKVSRQGRKLLLGRLASRILPPTFAQNRKQGFSVPLGDWLREGPWRRFFEGVLFDESQMMFCKKEIRNLFAGLDRGRANSERLFALVMFELWRREYMVSI